MAFSREKSQREVGRILFSLERLRCLHKLTLQKESCCKTLNDFVKLKKTKQFLLLLIASNHIKVKKVCAVNKKKKKREKKSVCDRKHSVLIKPRISWYFEMKAATGNLHIRLKTEICTQRGEKRPIIFSRDILTFCVAGFAQTKREGTQVHIHLHTHR